MADAPLPAVRPPGLVYRVARGLDVFAPPDWAYALPDGTFGNRFDDPSADRGVPEGERYRAIYCATERAGAFGETIARFRPSIELLAGLEAIEDDEPLDPELRGGVVPEEWRLSRRVGSTRLASSLLFADLPAPETMRILREELAVVAKELGLEDLDLSAVTGPHRRLTQEAARYVYDLNDPSGQPIFAGIRYISRLNPTWELWAVFHDRMRHEPGEVAEPIRADDPGLVEAAAPLGLSVE
ncbi:MAG: RES domain-containing protein [Rubrobacteraceae bacterium]|nr:RES domain-containing protein [Rubrobacteraceae bacterium]